MRARIGFGLRVLKVPDDDDDTSYDSFVEVDQQMMKTWRLQRLFALVDHLLGRGLDSQESLLETLAVRTSATWKSYETRMLSLTSDGDMDHALVIRAYDLHVADVQHHHGAQLLER